MTAPAGQLPMTEDEWQSRVLDYALLHGWLCHHTRPARTANGWRTPVQGHKGFPDWVFARRGSLVIAELKIGKLAKASLSPSQLEWISVLFTCPGIDVRIWTPSDWDEVQEVLL